MPVSAPIGGRGKSGEKQGDSKLLSGFPFLGHENPDSILESLCRAVMRQNGPVRPAGAALELIWMILYQT
jgi:hypothetical protein